MSAAVALSLDDVLKLARAYTPAPRRRSARVDDGPASRDKFWRPDHSGDFRHEQRGTW
ncbi:MAG: hypothetical protein OXH04_19380 [Acidobacteria bacterium]|nr:hypothetical protein [Acidobacteriota bacterium]